MADSPGTAHARGRELLRGWWWPVGPKLVFEQMAASVPEITDGSLYFCVSCHYQSKPRLFLYNWINEIYLCNGKTSVLFMR
jgi:hypothetical protein